MIENFRPKIFKKFLKKNYKCYRRTGSVYYTIKAIFQIAFILYVIIVSNADEFGFLPYWLQLMVIWQFVERFFKFTFKIFFFP